MARASGPARLRLFRTTAFRLAAIYLAVFTIFAGFLIFYIAKNTGQILTQQIRETVNTEIKVLANQYRNGGIVRLTRAIDRFSRRPGASLYLVTSRSGEIIAGNISFVPAEIIDNPDPDLRTIPYRRLDEDREVSSHVAIARVFALPGGYRVLVGRDLGERERFAEVIRRALFLTVALMVVLGLASWLFVSRRVLKRIDSVAVTSRQIMAGDLSGRLEVTGTGDEFDRLAESLNTMLGRIERLLTGLKEVSDNIAHDLKTPLSRMRNRVETALARAGSEPEYRDALEATIEDADQLIRTFNALLMIARVEAGSSDAQFAKVDAAGIAADVFELYEPLAEEAGVALNVDAPEPVPLVANRELLSQALANLVDNAIKYATEAEDGPSVAIAAARRDGSAVLSVSDNGPGIAADNRDRVAERFIRLEESRSKPGAGLGLSLVSAVAHLHSGSLELGDNNPGLRAELILPADGGDDHGAHKVSATS
jgi:signal transduction histidine kinase